MPSLDAVVVNYRTPGDLRTFVDSWNNFRPEFDSRLLIVNVDPRPDDKEAALKATVESEDIFLLESEDNCGYARACNAAATYATGDVLAFFNADVVLTPDALERCYFALMGREDWGVLGPRQVDSSGRLTAAGIIGTNDQPRHRGWHQQDRGQFSDVVEDCPTVSGAAYFIKRPLWDELTECERYRYAAPEAVGAFLPTRHYYEETFCSYHARAHGAKVVYYGEVAVVHEWHKASPVGGHADRLMTASRDYFRFACDIHDIAHD